MANEASLIFPLRTGQYCRQQIQPEFQVNVDRTNRILFTVDGVQPIKKKYGVHSKYRPLCLRRVINELQQDFPLTQKIPARTYEKNTNNSKGLRSHISDLRVTEIALQNATAYKRSSEWSPQSSSSLERILKEKINRHSRKKWRHGTEPGLYNSMWRSLARDVQEHVGNRKGEVSESLTAPKNGRGKEELTAKNLKKISNEGLSTTSSKQNKNATPGSLNRSPRPVLPRIVLHL